MLHTWICNNKKFIFHFNYNLSKKIKYYQKVLIEKNTEVSTNVTINIKEAVKLKDNFKIKTAADFIFHTLV